MNTPSVVQIQLKPDVIDLGMGNPPLALLPLEMIRSASQTALATQDNAFLQYGAEQGDGFLRLSLASFLSEGYGFTTRPENLFITNGISNGLDVLCSLFTQAGDTIFVEEPTYFLALNVFRDHGLNIIPIETDEHGIVPASLSAKLAGFRPKFLYLIPSFQNPTGRVLPQSRRAELVKLAEQHNFMLIADEVYQLLSFGGYTPDPSFGSYIDSPHVVSLGSFSKILAPGLRLGWIQAHESLIARLTGSGLLDSGGGLNPFTSKIVHEVIVSGGLKKNIGELTSVYADRVSAMDEALRRHLPQAKYTVPRGGYFFWLELPSHVDAGDLRKKAPAFNVDIRQGALFSSDNGLKNFMRLCFVNYEAEMIEEGVKRIRQCLDA